MSLRPLVCQMKDLAKEDLKGLTFPLSPSVSFSASPFLGGGFNVKRLGSEGQDFQA